MFSTATVQRNEQGIINVLLVSLDGKVQVRLLQTWPQRPKSHNTRQTGTMANFISEKKACSNTC